MPVMPAEPVDAPPLPDEERETARILVVDDDKVMRDVLEDILTMGGYVVRVAATGAEALDLLRHNQYDLLITDMRMPGYDGFAVLEEAQRVSPGTDVIVMTGYASVDVAVECMKKGARDFITKPFNVDHIQLIARRTLETKALKQKAAQTDYYQELALTDGLTNIFNKRYFMQLLETEVARSTRKGHSFVLVMLDIDNFKDFNDANGHLAGDEALKKVAWLLNHYSRTSDIVARFGGEEFALILPEMTLADGRLAAERLRRIVQETPITGEEKLPGGQLTISLGLSVFPQDAETPVTLLECADRALYAAKFEGRNLVKSWDELGA